MRIRPENPHEGLPRCHLRRAALEDRLHEFRWLTRLGPATRLVDLEFPMNAIIPVCELLLPTDHARFSQCHASTLVLLPDGDLLVAFFAGARESEGDTAIWIARRSDGRWNNAQRLIAEHAKRPFLLGYRISPEESGEGALRIGDTYVLIDRLIETGVDYIHASHFDIPNAKPLDYTGWQTTAELIIEHVGDRVPLIAAGLIRTPGTRKKH